MANYAAILIFSGCVAVSSADSNSSLSMCGNPSNPKMSEGYECTGALFTAVDINQFNTLKNEKGCVAGMLGLSTQLKGYHCLAFKNCPGSDCTCEVRQGCSSSKGAAETTKACLYGVSDASECPADVPAGAHSPATSSASSRCSTIFVFFLIAMCLLGTDADYNTSLSMCGNPSNPKMTEGYECTGALFTLVDINQFNTLKSEKGCVAGMLGISTQLTGYHCLAFKNCPGSSCTCEVRQGCSSSKAAAADTTKACLYGVKEASECPADMPAGSSPATSFAGSKGVIVAISIVFCGLILSILL